VAPGHQLDQPDQLDWGLQVQEFGKQVAVSAAVAGMQTVAAVEQTVAVWVQTAVAAVEQTVVVVVEEQTVEQLVVGKQVAGGRLLEGGQEGGQSHHLGYHHERSREAECPQLSAVREVSVVVVEVGQ